VLQVRELSVEVGGRLTLVDASFSLHAGDKVGLVGRNGAGKTSMLKVIAGSAPAAAGVVLRPEGLGYLPQDPPAPRRGLDGTALAHVLSGRGLDAEARKLEELRVKVENDPSGAQRPRVRERGGRVPRRGRLRGGVGSPTHQRRPRARFGSSRPAD